MRALKPFAPDDPRLAVRIADRKAEVEERLLNASVNALRRGVDRRFLSHRVEHHRLGPGRQFHANALRGRRVGRDENNDPQFAQPRLVSDVPGLGAWRRVLLVDDIYLSGKSWNAARAVLPPKVEVVPFVLWGHVEFALYHDRRARTEWPWQTG